MNPRSLGLYAACSECGQYVRNTPLDWHDHVCNVRATALRQIGSPLGGVTGFPGKVRPGGSGPKMVMDYDLELALIELTTDLTRWNEFAAWEGNSLAA